MTDGDFYERFEYIDPPRHRKFYELEVELAFFYPKLLIRRWGRIGTRRPRGLHQVYSTQEELMTVVTHPATSIPSWISSCPTQHAGQQEISQPVTDSVPTAAAL